MNDFDSVQRKQVSAFDDFLIKKICLNGLEIELQTAVKTGQEVNDDWMNSSRGVETSFNHSTYLTYLLIDLGADRK